MAVGPGIAMRPVVVGGVPSRVARAGSGPPTLVLHGWGAKIEAVDPIVRGLAGVTEVHALDLPGFGESEPPPAAWGVGDYADWVLGYMDQEGIATANLVGHSFGGRISIVLANRHPERVGKVILVDSAGIRPRRTFTWYVKVGLAKIGKYAARWLGAPGRRLQRALVGRSASSDYASAGVLRPTFVKVVNEDLRHLLPGIAAPTLLVWGSEDEATPVADAREMEKLIPDAGLVVFDGAGHYAYLDQPARFTRVAQAFLGPA